jgi:TonB family protein
MRLLPRFLSTVVVTMGCASSPPPEPAPAPVVARVEPAPKPSVPTELTGDLVRPVLAQMDGAVRGCYALEYGGQQDMGGRLVVDWLIAPSGEVESASIVESSFGNPSFESCVLEEAQGLEFPAARRPTQIQKPYLVRRSDSETEEAGL